MKIGVLLGLMALPAVGQSVLVRPSANEVSPTALCSRSPDVCAPDAPQPQPVKAGFWTISEPDDAQPLRSNREVWHDKTWRGLQLFWLGAIVYDMELTHAGIARHKCVEVNQNLPQHPSRGRLYLENLPEYAAGTAFNWLALRYIGKPLIFVFPAMASEVHLRAGSTWPTNCW